MASRPTATEAGATATYFALTPIEHNLEPYQPGDPIELTEKEAEPLLAVKAIKPEGEAAADAE